MIIKETRVSRYNGVNLIKFLSKCHLIIRKNIWGGGGGKIRLNTTHHFCCNKKLLSNYGRWHNFHPRSFQSNSVHLGPIDSHLHRCNHHVQCNWYRIGLFHWNLHILWCLQLDNFQMWLQHPLFQMRKVLENWEHNLLLIIIRYPISLEFCTQYVPF